MSPNRVLALFFGLAVTASVFALQPQTPAQSREGAIPLSRQKARRLPVEANGAATPQSLGAAGLAANPAIAAMLANWSDAKAALGPHAIVYLDPRTGGPTGVQPDGLPWIPGRGVNNRLTADDLAKFGAGSAAAAARPDDALLERIARDFMTRHPRWFTVPQDQLVLRPDYVTDPAATVRHVTFDQVVRGVPVEEAALVFHLNHGNLVSFGGTFLSPVNEAPEAKLKAAEVPGLVWNYAGLADRGRLTVSAAPALKWVVEDDGAAVPGAGYRHRLVYAMSFSVAGESPLWLAEVDARSGEVITLRDSNEYGQIGGGVYPLSNDGINPGGIEIAGYPMPYTNTGLASPNNFTDTGGNYNAASGTITTTLNGKYTNISDNCGAISESVTAPGNLDLGTSGGTDCTIPAGHSAGDTHSSRTAFYNVTKTKEEVLGWVTGFNTTLTTFTGNSVRVNVNINNTCNAYWTSGAGGSLNMYRSGGGCNNTGEIAMIFDHEIGHGFDSNDGDGSLASPGEAYADDTAFLHHHDSCIGRGFFQTGTCGGYGDACTTCTGVRDQDWTKHTSSTPHTVNDIVNGTGYTCGAALCTGPCGRECHCESYPISESMWDLANIDLPHNAIPANGGAACAAATNPMNQSAAWTHASKLWWRSVGSLTSQYSCTAAQITARTTGCGANNLFHLLKVQDDDDGNLTNGTPHAAEIQCAFDRHIAGCATDNNVDFSSCPAIGVPTLTVAAGNGQNTLTWTAVANAASYRVMRNEDSCGAGYTVIATVAAPTVTYTDTGLLNGRTYYYQVQAVGSNAACSGNPSACVTGVPSNTCSTPTGFANNTATDVSACAASGITVSWTAPTAWGDTTGTRSYTVLRDGVAVAAGACSGALPTTTTSCVDIPGDALSHTYTVRATNGCGSSATTTGAAATDVNNSPAAPTAVSATTANCANVTVSWTNGTGSTSTNLLRYAGACPSTTGLTTFTAVTSPYADATAASGASYCYVARAVNACGTADAAGVTGTRAAAVGTPGAPTATATCAGINLTWTAVSGATSYNVLRSTTTCGAATQIATGVATTSYSDTTAVAGTAYIYSIQAVSGCGAGTAGACSASATMPATPAPTVTGGPAGCSPVALSTQAFTTYQWALNGTNITGATAQSYGATASGNYTVTVTNAAGCSGTSPAAAITVNAIPAAPVQNAASPGNTQVTVNWAASAGASTYQVKRGATGGPYANTGAAQTGTSFTDTGLTNGTQYCYVVTASNSCGTSGNSNEQCATPSACTPNVRLNDNFEAGTANWTISGSWAASTTVAGSPVTSLRGSDPGSNPQRNTCRTAATAAAIAIPAGSTGAQLRFWSQTALAADDYGIVEVSTNGGTSWSKLTTVNYPGTVSVAPAATCATLAVGNPAFAGTTPAATYAASLTAFAGQSLLIRFNYVTGGTNETNSFWYVDDVRVTDGNGVAGTMTTLKQAKSASDLVESWAATAGGENYFVYRGATSNPASWAGPVAVPASTATGWTDAGQLAGATSQFYSVTLYNGCAETAK